MRWFLNVGWGHEHPNERKEGSQRLEDLETPSCCYMGYIMDGAASGSWESKSLVCGSYEHMTEF